MFVVTLPHSAQKNPLAFADEAEREGAHVLEIRTDLTPNVKPFRSTLPLLVSVRTKTDALVDRLQPAYVDYEESADSAWIPKDAKLILSFHDHEKTPSLSALKAIAKRMAQQKPWAIKVATFIRDYDDLLILGALQESLKIFGVNSIVLGMGPKAHLSRLESPLRNIFTYAALNPSDASAPGQLLMSFYWLTEGRKNPVIFGILGGPHVTASLSPVIHNALFHRHSIDALYSSFPTENFSKTMKTLEKLDIKGLSVTAPFKHDAFDFSASLEAISGKLRVTNTLVRNGKKWKGFLTDAYGIQEGYGALKQAKKVAILGAGGAVPSAIEAVRQKNPKAEITVYVRDRKKAKRNLKAFDIEVKDLKVAAAHSADIVLCAISEDTVLPMPGPTNMKAVAIDLRYGKETQFMKVAKRKGFRVEDGTNMLIHQALKQFRHFTGRATHEDDAKLLKEILTSFLISYGK